MNTSDNFYSKLRIWVGCDTWHTDGPLDEERFYDFVDAYINENGLSINDETIVAETIATEAGISTTDPRYDIVREKVTLMYSILDFLKATDRK